MDKIIEGAKIYFQENEDLQVIFASPDGQYFYDAGNCGGYCSRNNLGKPIVIEREPEVSKEDISEDVEKAPKKRKPNGNTQKNTGK